MIACRVLTNARAVKVIMSALLVKKDTGAVYVNTAVKTVSANVTANLAVWETAH